MREGRTLFQKILVKILSSEDKIYIGIDPGKSGGISVVTDNLAIAHKMPQSEKDLYVLLKEISTQGGCFAALEKVHSSPQMGVKSAFTFGQGKGSLIMALTALGIPFEEVRPQVWQKALGCMSKGDKNVTKRKAQQLFPDVKITHAIADALLIGEYARRTYF